MSTGPEQPDSPPAARRLVVYDGECEVCGAFRRWVEARDARRRLRFVANQDPELTETAPRVDRADAKRTLHVVEPSGGVHRGARAVFETVAQLPGPWGAVARAMAWPPLSLLAEPFYRLFARYRGHLGRFVRP